MEGRAIELVQATRTSPWVASGCNRQTAVERLATAEADVRTGRLDGILGGLVIDGEALIGVGLTGLQVIQPRDLINVEDGIEP